MGVNAIKDDIDKLAAKMDEGILSAPIVSFQACCASRLGVGGWVSVDRMFVMFAIPSFHMHHQRQGREQVTEVLRDISKELDGHLKALNRLDNKLGKRQHVPEGYHNMLS